MDALKKIKQLQTELESVVVERTEEIEALLVALIARVHVLLLGPPGTAKSMLAQLLCEAIQGGEYFQWLLTKFSTPEELFGPISLKGLENDSYRRITTGKLPQAHVAFLDEIFKANSAILNALLTLINERKFHNNSTSEDVPLLSCIGASNELPESEELNALYDRFILRFWVKPLQEEQAFTDLITGAMNAKVTVSLTLDEVQQLHEKCNKIELSDEQVKTIRKIYEELKAKGITASDRRWKTAVGVLKAYALLRGKTEITGDEIEVLTHMLWQNPEDKRTIMSVVAPHANPLNLKAIEYLDFAKEIFDKWQNPPDELSESDAALQANNSLKEMLKDIKSDMHDRPKNKTKKLRETQSKVQEYKDQVLASLSLD